MPFKIFKRTFCYAKNVYNGVLKNVMFVQKLIFNAVYEHKTSLRKKLPLRTEKFYLKIIETHVSTRAI